MHPLPHEMLIFMVKMGPLGASWGPLGGPLGAPWGPLGGLLGASWGPPGGLLAYGIEFWAPPGPQEAENAKNPRFFEDFGAPESRNMNLT